MPGRSTAKPRKIVIGLPRAAEKDESEVRWLISYSDFMMQLVCLFILLFFKRPNSLTAFVPLCLLLALNAAILVTDYFLPSPIVFYTLANIFLFVCLASILGFELYANVLRQRPLAAAAVIEPPYVPNDGKRRERQRKTRARRK